MSISSLELLLSPFFDTSNTTFLLFLHKNKICIQFLIKNNYKILEFLKENEIIHYHELKEFLFNLKEKEFNLKENATNLIITNNLYFQHVTTSHQKVEKIIHYIIKFICNEKNLDYFCQEKIISFLLPKSNNFLYLQDKYFNEKTFNKEISNNYIDYYNWLFLYSMMFSQYIE